MFKIEIQNKFWNQFWSLIPKLVSHFCVIMFNLAFWVPKNGTSGAQNQNLIPVLESVTKTDSKTCFRFQL